MGEDGWIELGDVVVVDDNILGAQRLADIVLVSQGSVGIELYREDHVTASIDGPKRKSAGPRKEIRHLELRTVIQPAYPAPEDLRSASFRSIKCIRVDPTIEHRRAVVKIFPVFIGDNC